MPTKRAGTRPAAQVEAKPAGPKKSVASKATALPPADHPRASNYVAAVRKDLGVTLKLFARLVGFSERAVGGWEAGMPASEPGLRRVKEMERLRRALADVMEAEAIPVWLETECAALGGLKPVEVLERGEVDRLWRTVFFLGAGTPI